MLPTSPGTTVPNTHTNVLQREKALTVQKIGEKLHSIVAQSPYDRMSKPMSPKQSVTVRSLGQTS